LKNSEYQWIEQLNPFLLATASDEFLQCIQARKQILLTVPSQNPVVVQKIVVHVIEGANYVATPLCANSKNEEG
jgi:hypothetical protein